MPASIKGLEKVSQTLRVEEDQVIELDTGQQRFRNYLLWITELPEGGKAVIKELSLEK